MSVFTNGGLGLLVFWALAGLLFFKLWRDAVRWHHDRVEGRGERVLRNVYFCVVLVCLVCACLVLNYMESRYAGPKPLVYKGLKVL